MPSNLTNLIHKPAPTERPIHSLLTNRWSPRAYDSEKAVPRDQLAQLFEAARWAPSSSNEQPWSFLVGEKGSETWVKIFDTLVPFNQAWTKNASVLVLGLARNTFQRNGSPNAYALYDLGQAVSMLLVEAESLGLTTHQMAGFDHAKAKETFAVPANYDVGSVIAIGYQADITVLPPDLQEKETAPRSRNKVESFVFEGAIGTAAVFPNAKP